jgi:hypothetical protein
MANQNPKSPFVFPDSAGAVMSAEARKVNALEFIAHYLDRIEGHLERLSATGADMGKLSGEIGMLRTTLIRNRSEN